MSFGRSNHYNYVCLWGTNKESSDSENDVLSHGATLPQITVNELPILIFLIDFYYKILYSLLFRRMLSTKTYNIQIAQYEKANNVFFNQLDCKNICYLIG